MRTALLVKHGKGKVFETKCGGKRHNVSNDEW